MSIGSGIYRIKRLDLRLTLLSVLMVLLSLLTAGAIYYFLRVEESKRLLRTDKEKVISYLQFNKERLIADLLLGHKISLEMALSEFYESLNLEYLSLESPNDVSLEKGVRPKEFSDVSYFPLKVGDRTLGKIAFSKGIKSGFEFSLFQQLMLVYIAIVSILWFYVVKWFFRNQVMLPINQIFEDSVNTQDNKSAGPILMRNDAEEIVKLKDKFYELKSQLIKSAEQEGVLKYVSRLAHNMQSSVFVLDSRISEDAVFKSDEAERIAKTASQRIRSHINRVMSACIDQSVNDSTGLEIRLLSSLLDRVVGEKTDEHRSRIDIDISLDLRQASYGLFVYLNESAFHDAISNLIENSVGALSDEKRSTHGKIVVELFSEGNNVIIQVSDNGKGIPKENLVKLGTYGFTSGKAHGKGIGVHDVITSVKSWGGTVQFTSEIGLGTTVTVKLPKSERPHWFSEEIIFSPESRFVILDDDRSIHTLWHGVLRSAGCLEAGVSIIDLFSYDELKNWCEKSRSDRDIFLIDYQLIQKTEKGFQYDLMERSKTGLDLIEEFSLMKQSILVTSYFESDFVQRRCIELGVKIIPKSSAWMVPIRMAEKDKDWFQTQTQFRNVDAVLIDDDVLIRREWERRARLHQKEIITFKDVKSFLVRFDQFSPLTPIYVDSILENGLNGEVESKKLYELGFKNLYLETAYTKDMSKPFWIKEIRDKTPPWKSVAQTVF